MTLKDHIYNELRSHEGEWRKKVELYILGDSLGYSPESVGRELRYLEEEGKIKRGTYDGAFAKNLVKYSYNPVEKKVQIKIIDGLATAIYA